MTSRVEEIRDPLLHYVHRGTDRGVLARPSLKHQSRGPHGRLISSLSGTLIYK